jgi:radical SAM superfamily enzyme YgiQ (UPF0313 family)
LLYIAQPLIEDGIDVEIIDQRLEKDFFGRVHQRITPKLICIGISCITGPQIEQVIRISEFIRKVTNTLIVLVGGPHATLFPEQTLESGLINYVVIGGGEAAFLNLVRALKMKASIQGVSQVGTRRTEGLLSIGVSCQESMFAEYPITLFPGMADLRQFLSSLPMAVNTIAPFVWKRSYIQNIMKYRSVMSCSWWRLL